MAVELALTERRASSCLGCERQGSLGQRPDRGHLAEDDDLTYAVGLVRQALEYQMGGDWLDREFRRSTDVLDRSLREQAAAALVEAVGGVQSPASSTSDLEIELDGHRVTVEVKTMAYATVDRVEALKRKDRSMGDRSVLVVADRINQPARAALREAGWGYLDIATGSPFLRAPGIRIDTTVDVVDPGTRPKPVGVVGRAGRVVAYELLRRRYDRDPRPVLTTTSFDQFDLAPSSTSDARRALIGAGLLTEDGEPLLPELFWALAREWAPTDRRWLASVPDPTDWERAHDPTEPTWRLGGTQAAIALGAPIVSAGETPAELYVPGPVLLSIAVRRYGSSDPLAAAASVAVPVVHQVTAPPDPASGERRHDGWLLVHPVAAALDLAASGDARSIQVLAEWQPDGEAVWHER
ncbi:MAG: hypothetical protein WBB52_01240 [Acidimicrobiales bacterium]